MACILVTGSTTGLGRAAAEALLDDGHEVVLHARSAERATELAPVAARARGIVIGDLARLDEARDVADQANALGPPDAVIHNAGIDGTPDRALTADGHPAVLAVNVLAPYLLTVLIERPARLVYLSSDMHVSGEADLGDLDWSERPWNGTQAYCDSKLFVTTLAAAIARPWPDTLTNSVDPGWVPTRMGGPHASDDLVLGHRTQVWLATSTEPAAMTTGRYWYHQAPQQPAPAVHDHAFQDALINTLATITGQPLDGPIGR